jgi:hypothetical protein
MTYTGKVKNGVIILDGEACLADGTEVRVEPIRTPSCTLGERLMKYAGQARDLPPDMAERHDHYLHGQPRE